MKRVWLECGGKSPNIILADCPDLDRAAATAAGAIASMSAGLIFSGIFAYIHQFMFKLPVHFSLYALTFSVLAMIIVSLLTKPVSEETLNMTHTGWYIQPR